MSLQRVSPVSLFLQLDMAHVHVLNVDFDFPQLVAVNAALLKFRKHLVPAAFVVISQIHSLIEVFVTPARIICSLILNYLLATVGAANLPVSALFVHALGLNSFLFNKIILFYNFDQKLISVIVPI